MAVSYDEGAPVASSRAVSEVSVACAVVVTSAVEMVVGLAMVLWAANGTEVYSAAVLDVAAARGTDEEEDTASWGTTADGDVVTALEEAWTAAVSEVAGLVKTAATELEADPTVVEALALWDASAAVTGQIVVERATTTVVIWPTTQSVDKEWHEAIVEL